MKVYAIIVMYNGKKWIDKCFSSLMNSDYPLDILVIDNGSTDNSREYLMKHFPEVELIEANKNLGFGAANNIGIAKAYERGADYFLLLNQDAWIDPGTVDKLVAAFQKNRNYGIISPMQLIGSGKKIEYGFSLNLNPKDCRGFLSDLYIEGIKDRVYQANFAPAACWLINRECISKVGGFSPVFFHYGEDNNYVDRVNYHGLDLGILPTAVMYHDIEHRGDLPLNKGENNIFKLKLMKFSSPLNDSKIDNYVKSMLKNMIKQGVRLSIGNVRSYYKEYKRFSPLVDKVNQNLSESKKKGLSFLKCNSENKEQSTQEKVYSKGRNSEHF